MSARAASGRRRADLGPALMEAAEAIADMAQRVKLNGPEVTYAGEKLGHALYKSAEALALCGVSLEEVIAEVHRGYRHGAREGGGMSLGSVKAGDIVLAQRRGWRFYAIVIARRERLLEVDPLDPRVTYHLVKAREVLEVWHKRSRARRRPDREPQRRLGRRRGGWERCAMSRAERLREPERVTLRRLPGQWRVPRRQIEAAAPSRVRPRRARAALRGGAGVAIMVDEARDRRLAGLFAWRRALGEAAFAAAWETNPAPHAHVLFCPHAPEALYAYQVSVLRPVTLTRTFLLPVSKHAHVLSLLREPGAVIWLVPQRVAIREWAREGVGSYEELVPHMLPVGQVQMPRRGLERALEHVG
jgi:hypothetical protein